MKHNPENGFVEAWDWFEAHPHRVLPNLELKTFLPWLVKEVLSEPDERSEVIPPYIKTEELYALMLMTIAEMAKRQELDVPGATVRMLRALGQTAAAQALTGYGHEPDAQDLS